jgi:hypothetical protein
MQLCSTVVCCRECREKQRLLNTQFAVAIGLSVLAVMLEYWVAPGTAFSGHLHCHDYHAIVFSHIVTCNAVKRPMIGAHCEDAINPSVLAVMPG